MTYTQRQYGPHLVIAFHGKLYDQLYATEIEKTGQNHISASEGNLILDMSGLEHINSSGLNLLLKLLNTYKSAQRAVIIAGANETVTGVLTITKLHTIFILADSVEEAIRQNNTQNIPH